MMMHTRHTPEECDCELKWMHRERRGDLREKRRMATLAESREEKNLPIITVTGGYELLYARLQTRRRSNKSTPTQYLVSVKQFANY